MKPLLRITSLGNLEMNTVFNVLFGISMPVHHSAQCTAHSSSSLQCSAGPQHPGQYDGRNQCTHRQDSIDAVLIIQLHNDIPEA